MDAGRVINGLEQFIVDFKPFCGSKADWQRVYDALALLKAQEPRVMTPEEVIGNIILGRDRVIWFEFRDSIVPMNTKSLAYDDYLVDDDMPILNDPNIEWRDSDGKKDGVIVAEYNDVFRCWTSRPTDAQREATPWDG